MIVRLNRLRSAVLPAFQIASSTLDSSEEIVGLKAAQRPDHPLPVRLVLFSIAIILLFLELHTSWTQAHVLSYVARRMTFHVVRAAGTPAIPVATGPYDNRLGYAGLRKALDNLQQAGYRVQAHAQSSGLAQEATKLGLPPIYREKTQAGLRIEDGSGRLIYHAITPRWTYPDYQSIPQLVVRSLLFAENREILDAGTPYRNPAVEWDRLALAVFDFGVSRIYHGHPVTGGSAVPTQLEKLRHSPGGRTTSPGEKFRQMLTASLRAYQDGPQSLAAREQIVCDYINSLPLAATRQRGEVIGLGDGLQAWFGEDAGRVNSLLEGDGPLNERAQAYREVLSLLLAAKKPSAYLIENPGALERRVDSYLVLLARKGVISASLRDAALKARPRLRDQSPAHSPSTLANRKDVGAIRAGLLSLLGVADLYDLDRYDLTVRTTLDQPAEEAVTRTLQSLNDARSAGQAGLFGEHLLNSAATNGLIYSFTLYERTAGGNVLRVQADNSGQPLNINRGTKLELGSTAKLRTLACYLELVAELHSRWAGKSPQELNAIPIHPEDVLSAWAIGYLSAAPDRSLPAMLEAAMNRKYSASSNEAFFTGSGLHYFSNYERSDNGRVLTVREAFERSVNLVFIRLLRDIVHYRMFQIPEARAVIDSGVNDPLRQHYLNRFADMEGREFLEQFYRKYKDQPESALNTLLAARPVTPVRFAAIFRYVRPDANLSEFENVAVKNSLWGRLHETESAYEKYGPEKFNLNDRAYLAHAHPLELWMVAWLSQHPHASFEDMVTASASVRQESYAWLFKSTRKRAQDMRIRILLEQDAFEAIYQSWKRLGFPFDRLVPSLATAIGSSGDNPDALATLAGIIVNGGIRYPSIRIRQLHFAEGTPMETVLEREPAEGERVMPEAVAAVLQREMVGVVEHGTAQRARRSIVLAGGRVIPIGGKTGTGDNRIEHFGPHGSVLESKVRNRTGAFVFTIGDRFFGTVLAYAEGPEAARQKFTSALAVQVFRDMTPAIRPLLGATAP